MMEELELACGRVQGNTGLSDLRVYFSLISLKHSSLPLLVRLRKVGRYHHHRLPSLPMMAGLNTVAAAPPGAEAVDLRCLRLFSSRLACWHGYSHHVSTESPRLLFFLLFPSTSTSTSTSTRLSPPFHLTSLLLAKRQEPISQQPKPRRRHTPSHRHDTIADPKNAIIKLTSTSILVN